MRPWALAAVGVGGGLVAAAAFASWSECACDKPPVQAEAVRVLAGASFLGVGVVALADRRRRRTGALMEAVGASWFIYELGYVYAPLPYTLARVAGGLWEPLLAHLVIGFPDGRLHSRTDRVIVASGYALYAAASLATSAFWDPRDAGCPVCPPNLLLVHRDPRAVDVMGAGTQVLVALLALAALAAVIRHWWTASVAGRRALAPVVWASMPLVALVVGYDVVGFREFPWLGPLALTALPTAFLTGLLRLRLGRAEVGRLAIQLQGRPPPAELRDALARTFHDPTLQVLFRLPGSGSYVDSGGAPVDLPPEGTGRVTTVLERDGQPIAALVHDVALLDDAELIEAATATAQLAIENEGLRAEIRAQLQEVLASRARIVSAADAERRRLERDLHDGAQQRLVTLLLSLRMTQSRLVSSADPWLATALAEAAEELGAALGELREFARGIHPPILTEAGLVPAIESLAHRCPVPTTIEADVEDRPPPAVEAAIYFAVSEALANVAKHARASRASVSVYELDGRILAQVTDDGVGGADPVSGTGLVGLMDRIGAVGGTLEVLSPAGAGTRVLASVPCRQLLPGSLPG
jgi:signal transduction histidine kinase